MVEVDGKAKAKEKRNFEIFSNWVAKHRKSRTEVPSKACRNHFWHSSLKGS